MLVRIDPRTKYISLLSLPRDLYVTIPGYGVDKINAAYSDGGYKLALKTVEDCHRRQAQLPGDRRLQGLP